MVAAVLAALNWIAKLPVLEAFFAYPIEFLLVAVGISAVCIFVSRSYYYGRLEGRRIEYEHKMNDVNDAHQADVARLQVEADRWEALFRSAVKNPDDYARSYNSMDVAEALDESWAAKAK